VFYLTYYSTDERSFVALYNYSLQVDKVFVDSVNAAVASSTSLFLYSNSFSHSADYEANKVSWADYSDLITSSY